MEDIKGYFHFGTKMYCTLCSVTFTQKMVVIHCTPLLTVQCLKYQEQNGGGKLDVRATQDKYEGVCP
jgi:hypothetical protein